MNTFAFVRLSRLFAPALCLLAPNAPGIVREPDALFDDGACRRQANHVRRLGADLLEIVLDCVVRGRVIGALQCLSLKSGAQA